VLQLESIEPNRYPGFRLVLENGLLEKENGFTGIIEGNHWHNYFLAGFFSENNKKIRENGKKSK
jgi:hypothetical protein